MIKKVLIANRGEIALRIIRACRELDIGVGIVYTREDANSLAVRQADEGFFIDAPSNKNPYLDQDKILNIALDRGYDSIHPGYGFLAENSEFAKKCKDNEIDFIGPEPEVIDLTGNKEKTKEIAKKVEVPVIEEFTRKKIKAKDYPILIKASLGGGGKGIRILYNPKEFNKLYEIVQREAERAFGKGQVLIEKYIPKARHIEIQIIADKFGKVVHLFERECSIQRKNQKLIEEAPCVFLSTSIKRKLYKYAKDLAKELKYTSVGTFEFLVDEQNNIYFLEVNPRIQVEHPVTEEITGIDIVKEQIKIAQGKKIPFSQKDVKVNGHAIECRVNSEDISQNFSPSTGKISELILPQGKGLRLHGDVYTGKNVYSTYDSLLLKVITKAKNREIAVKRMQQALRELKIKGIKTTKPLLETVMTNKNFMDGNLSTEFLTLNNSLKAARRKLVEQAEDDQLNIKELEFEKTALIAATIFEQMNRKMNANGATSKWVSRSRMGY